MMMPENNTHNLNIEILSLFVEVYVKNVNRHTWTHDKHPNHHHNTELLLNNANIKKNKLEIND